MNPHLWGPEVIFMGLWLTYLAADCRDLTVASVSVLRHGGELSLVVHLEQLQSPGAVAHLGEGATVSVIKHLHEGNSYIQRTTRQRGLFLTP